MPGATPNACDDRRSNRAGTGPATTSSRWIVPGRPPETAASTRITSSPSFQRSRSAAPSPATSTTRTSAGRRGRALRATIRPAASSPARGFPVPMRTRVKASGPLDREAQEVRRARDARVVVSDGLLAAQRQLVVREREILLDEEPEVVFDRPEVLRRRRDDLRLLEEAVRADPVPVVENSTRRLRAGHPDAVPRRDVHPGAPGRFVGREDAERLVDRINGLHRAHDDALKRISADGRETGRSRELLHGRREPVEIEAVARERPDEIGAALLERRVEGVRALDVLFGEPAFVVADRDVEPAARNEPPLVERVFRGVPKRDELVVRSEVRKRESGDDLDDPDGDVAPRLQLLREGREVLF